MKHYIFCLLLILLCACQSVQTPPSQEYGGATLVANENKPSPGIGHVIDELNGIPIYYNGSTRHTAGRHKSADGYNYGLRWQCVEFVKRYYYDYLSHKLPNPWGHAKHFFNLNLIEGAFNQERGLYQFRNGSKRRPEVDDIVVFWGPSFGHVAIVVEVGDDHVELAQQNVGVETRVRLPISKRKDRWIIRDSAVLGWLGMNK